MALASRTRRINIYINGKEVTNDIRSITKAIRELDNKTRALNMNTEEYHQNIRKISRLNAILAEHRAAISATNQSLFTLKGLANAFNKYWPIIMGSIGAFIGAVSGIRNLTEKFTEFDDKIADVMKTTGLTRDQVISLNNAFKLLDTRTAQNELLDLAYIAGKLGYSTQEDVYGFVSAMDKIGVALKSDLGGNIEETANQLGKLVEVFHLRDSFSMEESLLKVGSAINELGMASTANEQYLVQFAKRVGGVAPLADVSIQDVLGLAASLDMLGQSAEVSATAYTMLMGKMNKETAKFANLVGMTYDDWKNLVSTDANEAMLLILESLNKTNGGFQSLVEGMDQVSMDGQRVTAVLGALAKNWQTVRQQQDLSNSAFNLGTSIIQEFNIKNNTAQAIIDKNAKKLSNLAIILSEKLLPIYVSSQNAGIKLMNGIVAITGFLFKYGNAIISLTAGLVMYKIALIATTMWQERLTAGTIAYTIAQKASAVATWISTLGTRLLSAAILLYAREITIAEAATYAFGGALTFATGGISAILGVLAAVGSAIWLYTSSTSDAADETKNLSDEIKRLTAEKLESIVKEKSELDMLTRAINLTNIGSSFRIKLIDELKAKYPELLGQIKSDTVANQELADALVLVNDNIKQRIDLAALEARTEAVQNKMVENGVKMLEITTNIKKLNDEAKKDDPNRYDYEIPSLIQAEQKKYDALSAENTDLENQLTALYDQRKTVKEQINKDKTDAMIRSRDALEAELKIKEKINGADQKELSDLRILIASLNKLINLEKTSGKDDGDPYNETNELAEINAEKKRYNQKLVDKFTYEQNIRRIELKFMQGRLATRQFEEDKKLELENQIEDKIAEIREAGSKENSRINNVKLKNDQDYQREKLKLITDRNNGLTSEREYNNLLLQLEIDTYDKRLKTLSEDSEEYLDTSLAYQEKLYEQKQNSIKYLAELEAVGAKENLVKKENDAYNELLVSKDLNKDDEKLTREQFKAKERAKKAHQTNLNNIDAAAYKEYFDNKSSNFEYDLAVLKNTHKTQLEAVRDNKEEYNRLQEQYQKEELDFTEKNMNELITEINNIMSGAQIEGINLSDLVLSEEEKKVILKILTDYINAKNELLGKKPGADLPQYDFRRGDTDILGFTAEHWEAFFKNLEKGEIGIKETATAVGALIDAYTQYSDFIAKIEDRNLTRKEDQAEKEKEVLSKQLEFGLISQESYDKQIAKMDAALDLERAKNDRKQALRKKDIALAQAAINTAVSVSELLATPWLAVAAGIMGAAQIALITATPIPELPGAEVGGHLVQRSQDGRRYRATYDPTKRGYINRPTVLTGENGLEYVIPSEAMQNPSIRNIIDGLEVARLNKNLATVNFDDIVRRSVLPGRFNGGYTDGSTVSTKKQTVPLHNEQQTAMMSEVIKTVKKLDKKLDHPLIAYVSLYGEKGLYRAMEVDDVIKYNSNL